MVRMIQAFTTRRKSEHGARIANIARKWLARWLGTTVKSRAPGS